MRRDAKIAIGALVLVLIAFAILAWLGYVDFGQVSPPPAQ
jgi:hypothetical protein